VSIDEDAPAVARGEIDIDAGIDVVWRILTTISEWPTWNPDVRSARLDGKLEPGTRFRWKAGPGTITSTLQVVEPPHRIAWIGRTMSIRAVHVYDLDERGGVTHVRSAESWDGLLVRILRGSLRKTLQTSTDKGLARLKAAAESG
jgi:uncharacterized protein YndB with AHSA1/START domain